MNDYDISVLLFTYRKSGSNREKYVVESIRSLREQKGVRIQAVILDDGSTNPMPPELVKNTDNIDFDYLRFPANQGKHVMLGKGLPMLKAPLSTFHGDDDLYPTSDSLKKRYDFFNIDRDRTAMIFTDAMYITMNESGDAIESEKQLYLNRVMTHSHDALLKNNYICGGSILVRTDLMRTHPPHPSLHHAEEYDMWLQISKYASLNNLQIRYLPEVTWTYRIHREQSWNSVRRMSPEERGKRYLNFIRNRSR